MRKTSLAELKEVFVSSRPGWHGENFLCSSWLRSESEYSLDNFVPEEEGNLSGWKSQVWKFGLAPVHDRFLREGVELTLWSLAAGEWEVGLRFTKKWSAGLSGGKVEND